MSTLNKVVCIVTILMVWRDRDGAVLSGHWAGRGQRYRPDQQGMFPLLRGVNGVKASLGWSFGSELPFSLRKV